MIDVFCSYFVQTSVIVDSLNKKNGCHNSYLPTILPQEVLSKAHRKVVESPRADNYVIYVHIEPHLINAMYAMAERL